MGACSGEEQGGGGAHPEGAPAPAEAAAARGPEDRSAEDWVALARVATRSPRTTSFLLKPGGGEDQAGTASYLDATRFRVLNRSRMTRSRPDGPPEHTPLTIELACDGEELRILVSAAGRSGNMMLLPAARLGELQQTTPGFTLEQLDPLHFTASLMERFHATSFEIQEGGRVLLEGTIPDGTLADFGMGGTDVVDADAEVLIHLDQATSHVVRLQLLPKVLQDGALDLELSGLESAPTGLSAYALALPPDAATMDLSASLPEPSSLKD